MRKHTPERQKHLIDEIKTLPEEALTELETFLQALKARVSQRSKTLTHPGGLWEQCGPVTEGEIDCWREELWALPGDASRDNLSHGVEK